MGNIKYPSTSSEYPIESSGDSIYPIDRSDLVAVDSFGNGGYRVETSYLFCAIIGGTDRNRSWA